MFLTLGIKILLLVSMGTRHTHSAFTNMQKKYTRLNKRKKCDIKKFLHIYLHRKLFQESANGLPGVKCLHGKGSYEQSEHTAAEQEKVCQLYARQVTKTRIHITQPKSTTAHQQMG